MCVYVRWSCCARELLEVEHGIRSGILEVKDRTNFKDGSLQYHSSRAFLIYQIFSK